MYFTQLCIVGVYLTGVHLTGMHLTSVYLTSVYLLQACISNRLHVAERAAGWVGFVLCLAVQGLFLTF